MLRKLPRWVEYGAFTLALLAGTVNAVGLLGFQHQSVSHLSGTTTMIGAELFSFSSSLPHLSGILFSFLLGSALSGYFISSESVKLGRNYDLLLVIEGLLLLVAIFFLDKHAPLGHYLASAACGLQNALATRYSGAVVRTTHVTGIFTDLGIMLGGALRGEAFDKRKCILFCLILLGFILGGAVGAYLFQSFQFMALIFPAGICFMLAVSYRLYSVRQRKVSR